MLLPYFQSDLIEAGCDEAGRGCLAGPVFAAAVILPKDFNHDVLTDSKQLSEKDRYQLRHYIEQEALAYGVAQADQTEIDRINIANASFLAMHRALDMLHMRPEFILVDGNRFKSYPNTTHQCIIRGDAIYFSIAAASILAKTYRDDWMHALSKDYPQYDWQNNKGYPTQNHRKAVYIHGLSPHHRKTFRISHAQLDLFANTDQN